jgi:type I restriction-modification system DNA methylase subunit/restriction endonuclease S subunit
MITPNNLKALLKTLKFIKSQNIYSKKFNAFDCELKVDFNNEKLLYPKALTLHDKTTSNFSSNENFVVFECVDRLLSQGYNPKHIELEPKWQVGHGASGGKADILIKDNNEKTLLIIECKTAGSEFKKAWDSTLVKPTQVFSYAQQDGDTKFIALYASDFLDKKLVSDYYLINLVDDEKYLFENNLKKSYKEAQTLEDIYKVWSETYKKSFTTKGIFESNKAYFIGLKKSNIDDLNIVSSTDIQGKYNDFATIMRQHNIGSPERSFNVLVNLFLCKIIDENSNQKNKESELKFYWKGVAYDDAFGLQDRLQELYQAGMFNFLNEKITYISDTMIDAMFAKTDINSIKVQVKQSFREQKFFTNNDFSFLDVHSEMLFYKNFEVLLKVIELFQDIRLTGVEDNQFLGDMFEGFLDNGVKQSEGQFFTPMPIVKFIINALPLDALKKQEDKPKAIDYACGAGHFLNEVAKIFDTEEVVGIEKEYRLSKVAKVSALMYGQENINIIYNDALAQNENIKEDSFSVLVANPPYSVKGFIKTLRDTDQNKFELIKSIETKSYTANNSIECFFIERAKQLLKPNGVAGIILPSSILSKGEGANTYVATREILLKYFDIVAIAEFGSGTFGKTGTNTVTLFLKRRNDLEIIVEKYDDLTQNIFKGNIHIQGQFTDKEILKKYTQHIGIDYDYYLSFLKDKPSKKCLKIEIVEAYLLAFEKATETKHRKKATYYKKYSKIQKYKTEKKAFIAYVKAIEADKFYYYALSCKNRPKILIIKAPTDNKANKKFLGYEWSGRKGNEGIQYNGGTLNSINTVLYNPIDKDDENKINTLITRNFSNEEVEIPEDLEEFVSKARVVDMLDFGRVEFSKAIKLNISKEVDIFSKWEIVKLENIIINLINGSTPSKSKKEYWNRNDINWLTTPDFNKNIYINSTLQFVSNQAWIDKKVTKIPINSVLITCTATIGKVAVSKIELTTNQQINALVCNEKKVIAEYMAYYMLTQKENLENLTSNSGVKHINMKMLNNFKIPLPPLNIQEEIVKACQKVDDEVEKANEMIEESEKNILSIMTSSSENTMIKLGEVCELKAGKFVSASDINDEYEEKLYPCYGANGFRGYVKTFTHEGTYSLIGRQGALCGNVTLVHGKFHATEHAVVVTPQIDLDVVWLYHKLVLMDINKYKTGTAQPGLSVKNIINVNVEVPTLKTQKEIVSKIEILESEIAKAKEVVEGASLRKEEILRDYL